MIGIVNFKPVNNQENKMKIIKLLLLVIIFAKDGHMSGMVKQVELEELINYHSGIFRVKIVGSSQAEVKEIAEKIGFDKAKFHLYHAEVVEQIHTSNQFDTNEENWTVLFSSPKAKNHRKTEDTSGCAIPDLRDTIMIMNQEYISQSMTYHVHGIRKIYIYYRCPDAADEINTGETYFFICGKLATPKNGVSYGSNGFGLYPDTKQIRDKITAALKGLERPVPKQ